MRRRQTSPRPASSGPSLRAAVLVFVLAFAATAPIASRQGPSYDGFIMGRVAVSLAEDRTPLVPLADLFGLNTPYSGYGIGTSLVMAVLYASADVVAGDAMRAMTLTSPLLFAGTIAGIFVLLRRRGHERGVVAVATALFAVGTPLLHYALLDFSEPGVALMVVLALVALDAVEKGSRWAAAGVGAAVGGAVLFRTDSWLLVAAPVFAALWWLSGRKWRQVGLASLALLPAASVWAAYNTARFGSLTSSGYSQQPFSNPMVKGLYGLVLSPGRGVFVYVPILLVAIAVVPLLRGSARVLGLVAVAMLVLRVVLYSRWWAWHGGASWGPRFMVPAVPAFAPVVADALVRWRRTPVVAVAGAATLVMGVIGFAVAVGALPFTYGESIPYDAGTLQHLPPEDRAAAFISDLTSDEYVEATNDLMFDWSRFPARRSSGRPDSTSKWATLIAGERR